VERTPTALEAIGVISSDERFRGTPSPSFQIIYNNRLQRATNFMEGHRSCRFAMTISRRPVAHHPFASSRGIRSAGAIIFRDAIRCANENVARLPARRSDDIFVSSVRVGEIGPICSQV
jgi:hypothetical protein